MGSQGDVTHALRTTDKKLESKRKTIITPPLHKEKAWDYEFIIQNICNTLDSHMKMSLGLISRPIFFLLCIRTAAENPTIINLIK